MRGTPPQYTLLGPLSVSRDGEPAAIGGQKRRALLAALLLDAEPGRLAATASSTRSGARTARHRAQHDPGLRLPAAKAPARGRARDAPPGYRLVVDPETVDLYRFARLCEEGRASARGRGRRRRGGDPARRARALARGAARGPRRRSRSRSAEIARLEELRLAALEDRIDADLALARHGRLDPGARTPRAEEPCASASAPS